MSSTTKLLKQYITEVINPPQDHKRLWIFDFDDTLCRTDSKIHVVNAEGVRRALSPGEFASYVEAPGEQFDYSDFLSLINPRPVKWVNRVLRAVYDCHGSEHITILSARGFPGPIHEYVTMHGMSGIEVVTLGSGANVTADAKVEWVSTRIEAKNYDSVIFLDDSARNVQAASQLPKDDARRVIHNRVAASLRP